MRLFPRGGFWWVDATPAGGKRLRKTTGVRVDDARAKKAAEDKAVEMLQELSDGHGPITLRQALNATYESHWSRTRSARAMNHMVEVLSREMGHHDVKRLTYPILKDYGDALIREGFAPATVNRRLAAVGVALRELVRRGPLRTRPELPHYAENNKRERYVSLAEEDAILEWLQCEANAEAARKDHDKAADWAYIRALSVFLLDTGFRFSEAFKFTVRDGHAVLKHGTTKNSKGRAVPLTTRAKAAADVLLSSPRHASLAALLDRNVEDKAPWDWVAYRWQRAVKACGCPEVTLHILRHTCASRLVQRRVDLYVVARWMGHSSVKITERYAHLAPDTLSQALAAMEGRPVAVSESFPGTQSSPHGSDFSDLGHSAKG